MVAALKPATDSSGALIAATDVIVAGSGLGPGLAKGLPGGAAADPLGPLAARKDPADVMSGAALGSAGAAAAPEESARPDGAGEPESAAGAATTAADSGGRESAAGAVEAIAVEAVGRESAPGAGGALGGK